MPPSEEGGMLTSAVCGRIDLPHTALEGPLAVLLDFVAVVAREDVPAGAAVEDVAAVAVLSVHEVIAGVAEEPILVAARLVLNGVIPVLALNRIVPRPALEAAAEVGVIAVRAAEHEVAAAPGVHEVVAGPRVARCASQTQDVVVGVLLQAGRCPVEAGGPALYGRLPHGVGDLQVHGRVEGVWDELALWGEGGQDLGGGDLHLGVDLLRAGHQGATEDAGVAEDVVHAAAVGGEGGARREGVLGFYLGVGVRERQDHLPLAHHLRLDEAGHARRRDHHVGLIHDCLHVGDLYALRAGALVRERVRVRGEHPLGPGVHHEGGDTEARGAQPDLAYHLLAQLQPGLAAGDQRRGERDYSRAVDVVVHNGLGEPLYEAGLYLETLRRRDVFEVDPAEPRRDVNHRLDEGVHVPGIDQYGHRRDAGELVVEDGLALHHRHRGHRPDIAQAQHSRSVRADGDAAADHGQLARERGILDDGLARPRHSWGVHVAHVLHRPDRMG